MIAAVAAICGGHAEAQVSTTTVQGVVYRADGTPATGTLIVSWPAFSTANSQAIAAGSTTAAIGQDGFVSVNLAANAGASPAGTYYTAVYHLGDGTVNKEYWVVPQAASASLTSVRAQLVPATVAMQSATKQYVDASIASLSGNYLQLSGGAMSGPLTLAGGPTAENQAASKQYVDQAVQTAVPVSGGNMTGPLRLPTMISKLPRVDVRHPDFVGGADNTGTLDSTAALQAADAFASSNHAPLYIPNGTYKVGSNLEIQSSIVTDGGANLNIASGATVTLAGESYSGPATVALTQNGMNVSNGLGLLALNPTVVSVPGMGHIYPSRYNITSFTGPRINQNANGYEIYEGDHVDNITLSPGLNRGVPPFSTPAGNVASSAHDDHVFRAGSGQAINTSSVYNASPGDTVSEYNYIIQSGGSIAGDDEGTEGYVAQLEDEWVNSNAPYQGTITSITSSHQIKTNCTNDCNVYNGNNFAGQGRYLLDLSHPSLTSYITASTNSNSTTPGILTIAGSVTPSTAWGTLANTVSTPVPSPMGTGSTAMTFTVNVTSGTFVAGQLACFAGNFHEMATIQSASAPSGGQQTLVANLREAHNANTWIMEGGPCGQFVDFTALHGDGFRFPIDIIGATSSNTLVYKGFLKADNNEFFLNTMLQIGTSGISSLSSSGTTVQFSAPFINVNSWALYNNAPVVTISGASDSALNGQCTNMQPVGSGPTWKCTKAGLSGTHTSASANLAYGDTPSGNGDFTLYPGAIVLDAEDAANNNLVDGAFTLEDNLNPWQTGDQVEESHHIAQNFVGIASRLNWHNPYALDWEGIQINLQGAGASGPSSWSIPGGAALGIHLYEPASLYQYFGGKLVPPDLISESASNGTNATYGNLINAFNPPAYNGSLFRVNNCPATGCGDTNYYYNIFSLNGQFGTARAQFEPSTNNVYLDANCSGCMYVVGSRGGGNTFGLVGNTQYQSSPNYSRPVVIRNTAGIAVQSNENHGVSSNALFDVLTNDAASYLHVQNGGQVKTANNTLDDGSGNTKIGGALTAASVNGEFTVDGTTYPTLNAAWTAAVNAANSTGRNQTVRLGPGTYAVTSTLSEPSNGACVDIVGSGGASTAADSTVSATTLNVSANLNGDVIFLGNAAQAQGCVFKDFTILANANATHGLELQWFRGLLIENVAVNDTTAEGILLGESSTAGGHQSGFLMRNIMVSYSASVFTPANRAAYGIHMQKTAMDSHLDTVLVRNAQVASVFNEGTGNTGYMIHGFGYPYTCTTAPCSNTAASQAASNASYATNYVIYDTGGAGSVWTDTYADSPAVAAFYVGANGTNIHGGHIQWPEMTSFPAADLAYVANTVTNGLEIADIGCLGMSSSANWITYAASSGVPPAFASVHHLTGCGNYAQALEPETTTGFTAGGASNNAPGNGAVATVWAAPKAGTPNYEAYSAQLYNGYQTDVLEAHVAGQNPFFNVTYQGTIRSQGGIALSTVINTASTLTLTAANKNVIANAASGPQTITLPSCYTQWADKAQPTGEEFTIIKSDTSSNAVTLATVSSQTINYQGVTGTSLVISSAGKRTLICAPDYNWYAY
jgi:hypothetical protein